MLAKEPTELQEIIDQLDQAVAFLIFIYCKEKIPLKPIEFLSNPGSVHSCNLIYFKKLVEKVGDVQKLINSVNVSLIIKRGLKNKIQIWT